MSNKRYGLILPSSAKSQKPVFKASHNVFGDDSDSEQEPKKVVLLKPNQNSNRQAKIDQEKAIKEDPTVYQYDEIYESMTKKKEEAKSKNKEEKKPRYIENLIKSANKRKVENERRIERQIQKEREKEGDEFADKEVFVTSAYKKKLEEMRLEEEKEKREEYLESIGDVTKQKDLGGFYRHLYEQKLGSDKKDDQKQNLEQEKESDVSTTPEPLVTFKKKSDKDPKAKNTDNYESSKKRNYRKRKMSSEVTRQLSEGEIADSDDEINRVNLSEIREGKRLKPTDENIDADSDFSVNDPSDDESPSETEIKKVEEKMTADIETPKKSEDLKREEKENSKENNSKPERTSTMTPEPKPVKPKIDIWKKRTVGEVFEQALKRYYERKAGRG